MPDRRVAVFRIQEEERLARRAIDADDLGASVVADHCGLTELRAQIGFVQTSRANGFATRRRIGQTHRIVSLAGRAAGGREDTQSQNCNEPFHAGFSPWVRRLNRCAIKAEPKKGASRLTPGMMDMTETSK